MRMRKVHCGYKGQCKSCKKEMELVNLQHIIENMKG